MCGFCFWRVPANSLFIALGASVHGALLVLSLLKVPHVSGNLKNGRGLLRSQNLGHIVHNPLRINRGTIGDKACQLLGISHVTLVSLRLGGLTRLANLLKHLLKNLAVLVPLGEQGDSGGQGGLAGNLLGHFDLLSALRRFWEWAFPSPH